MDSQLLFYDGSCGLCHRIVRFLLAVDRRGVFRFAPIGGPTFLEATTAQERVDLPDSVLIRGDDGTLLVRSSAMIHMLRLLGGPWSVLAALIALFPESFRDRVYDAVARSRRRLFATPESACPVVPPGLRARFAP